MHTIEAEPRIYAQPTYTEFNRTPGLALIVFADERVDDALSDPRSMYTAEHSALLAQPHLDLKLAQSRIVADDEVLAYFRRPMTYARRITAFPFDTGDIRVVFVQDSREPAFVGELVSFYFDPDGSMATGFMVWRVLDVNVFADGVSRDMRRIAFALDGNGRA